MRTTKKGIGGGSILGAAIALITLIVIMSILNSITIDTNYGTNTVNESKGKTNGTGYLSTTLSNSPVFAGSESVLCNSTTLIETGNWTLTDSTGVMIIDSSAAYCNATTTVKVTYQYEGGSYLDSALSRTITSYIVPIGLLGALTLAAIGAFS